MSAMPTWDQFMVPALRVLVSVGASSRREMYELVAVDTGLTEEQKSELLASGQTKYQNRIGWALSNLTKAKLLSRPVRATYAITDLGRQMLNQHPAAITKADLRLVPGYEEPHKTKPTSSVPVEPIDAQEPALDPVEQVEEGIARINEQVGSEILEHLTAQEPAFFERVVVDLIVAMGYGGQDAKAVRTQLTNDEGIDGVIDEDVLGLSSVYVQAKLYALGRSVHRPEVQAFVGALHGKRANQGVFFTTGHFSSGAHTYARAIQDRVVLIDGDRLARLMIRYRVGAQTVRTVSIVKTDEDFFE
ncbi:restriction endonuclease [Propionibacterium sp.]|uniref:restriction endonuclease n=1 Tax=Propionibacterium sp. TaxID=1977903 RepID=UPI0039ECE803